MRLGFLLTSHNRKNYTLRCLDCIQNQKHLLPDIIIEIFLFDDGSTDGTVESVKKYSGVKLFIGDGNFYWARGMHYVWSEALKEKLDVYITINDDAFLMPDSISRFLYYHNTIIKQNRLAILVGSTVSSDGTKTTYGGVRRINRFDPINMEVINVNNSLQKCETFNANLLWIPNSVVEYIGIFDKCFSHAMADFDYGLRAKKAGIPLWIIPGSLAICDDDSGPFPWYQKEYSLKERYNKIFHPKGLPLIEWAIYCQRHAGWAWMRFWLGPYIKILFVYLTQIFKIAINGIFNHSSFPFKKD